MYTILRIFHQCSSKSVDVWCPTVLRTCLPLANSAQYHEQAKSVVNVTATSCQHLSQVTIRLLIGAKDLHVVSPLNHELFSLEISFSLYMLLMHHGESSAF